MTDKKQRVLIVHNYYQIPGGEDTVVANEKKLLEKYGHKVFLYTRNNSELKTMSKLEKIFLPLAIFYNIRTVKDIKKIIKEEQVDIVHVHNTISLISPSVYYISVRCKIPVVQTIHNFRLLCPCGIFYRDGHICEDCTKYGMICAVKHSCYRNSRLQTLACVVNIRIHKIIGIYKKINYICLTEFNKEKLLQFKQIKENRIFVKPNFVENSEKFILAEKREFQFIFAGRLDKLKGIDLLLETWNDMQSNASKLIICGTGSMEDCCREYVSKNNINVEFKGFISNTKVKKIIANSKALILPTQLYEGFPMTIVEAYSVGTPVICSNLGNAGSLVIDGITGYKFNTKEEMIQCINKVISDENIHNTTREYYCNNYTEEINYNILKSIYERVSDE